MDHNQSNNDLFVKIEERLDQSIKDLRDEVNKRIEEQFAGLSKRIDDVLGSISSSYAAVSPSIKEARDGANRRTDEQAASLSKRIEDLSASHSKRIEDLSASHSKRIDEVSGRETKIFGALTCIIIVASYLGFINAREFQKDMKDEQKRIHESVKDKLTEIGVTQNWFVHKMDALKDDASTVEKQTVASAKNIDDFKKVLGVHKAYLLRRMSRDYAFFLENLAMGANNQGILDQVNDNQYALGELMKVLGDRKDEQSKVNVLYEIGKAITLYRELDGRFGAGLRGPLDQINAQWEVVAALCNRDFATENDEVSIPKSDLLAYSHNAIAVTLLHKSFVALDEGEKQNLLKFAKKNTELAAGYRKDFSRTYINRLVIKKWAELVPLGKRIRENQANARPLLATYKEHYDSAMSDLKLAESYGVNSPAMIATVSNNRADFRIIYAKILIDLAMRESKSKDEDFLKEAENLLKQAGDDFTSIRWLVDKSPVLFLTEAERLASLIRIEIIQDSKRLKDSNYCEKNYDKVKNVFADARKYGYRWTEDKAGFKKYIESTDLVVLGELFRALNAKRSQNYIDDLLETTGIE